MPRFAPAAVAANKSLKPTPLRGFVELGWRSGIIGSGKPAQRRGLAQVLGAKMRMSNKRVADLATATYARSYLVTLGLTFVAVSLLLGLPAGKLADVWPQLLLPLGFFSAGFGLLAWGLAGPTAKMEHWAELSSRHEASVILIFLAYPVYVALRPFYGGR